MTHALEGTVLVAQESLVNRNALVLFLHEHGIRCLAADKGECALELARSERIDLIILDRWLTKPDTLTMAKKIRRDGMDTPILILAAREDQGDRFLFLSSGCDHYLSGPDLLSEFSEILQMHLGTMTGALSGRV